MSWREPIATNVQTVRFKGMRAPRSSVERPGHALASFRELIAPPAAPPAAPPPARSGGENPFMQHFGPQKGDEGNHATCRLKPPDPPPLTSAQHPVRVRHTEAGGNGSEF